MDYYGQNGEKLSSIIDRRTNRVMLSCEELGIVCFGRYTNYYPEGGLREHDHHGAVEICYLEKGMQIYSVGGNDYQLSGGDIFVTYPHELHSSNGYSQQRGTLLWLMLEFEETCCLSLSREDCDTLLSVLRSMPQRCFKIDDECAELLKESFRLIMRDSQLNRMLISANLVRFIYKITEQSIILANNSNDMIVEACSKYIRNNCEEKITIEDLASLLNYSLPHFKAVFKKAAGVPPHEFILREKIEMSKALLKNTSIVDTAYILGFSSGQHFSRVFQSIVGICPSDFKAGFRKETQIS